MNPITQLPLPFEFIAFMTILIVSIAAVWVAIAIVGFGLLALARRGKGLAVSLYSRMTARKTTVSVKNSGS